MTTLALCEIAQSCLPNAIADLRLVSLHLGNAVRLSRARQWPGWLSEDVVWLLRLTLTTLSSLVEVSYTSHR